MRRGRGDSEKKNGAGGCRVKWNGEDTGRFEGDIRTEKEKWGKGVVRIPSGSSLLNHPFLNWSTEDEGAKRA